ncbi:Arm DNA-binding domain-containing protein [Burkholderia sp. BCC0419]|uniref:Arm DNA-binding domain-containing protein n=1 Tax=Burkholderia sp. BCC0419 TaxID=486878 RepID=UPI003264168F
MPLTDIKIRQAKAANKPAKLADGNGPYLEVRPPGSTLWRYRYRRAPKENVFAVGAYPRSVCKTLANPRANRFGHRWRESDGRRNAAISVNPPAVGRRPCSDRSPSRSTAPHQPP